MEITKITDGLVHLHHASNYAREMLSTPEWEVITRVAGDFFLITTRRKGSLDGDQVGIKLSDGRNDMIPPEYLSLAVEGLKAKIKSY
jgi:hypothetical protein